MYVIQGIGLGLMTVAIPAYLADQGASASVVGGFIGAIMLPWSLKIIAGPIMDRFSFLPMGRRRPWVMAGILGTSFGYALMGSISDPLHHLEAFTIAAVIASSFTAFMDVAIDGLAIEIVPLQEQPRANAFMWGGKVLGAAATTAGAAWTLRQFGLSATSYIATVCSVLFLLLPLFLRERPGERLLPWSKGQPSAESLSAQLHGWKDILQSLTKVVFLPASLLIALAGFLHGITYGLFDAFMPMITVQEMGWSDQAYSNLAALSGLIAGILGFLAGGPLINRLGRKKILSRLLLALVILAFLMGMANPWWEAYATIQVYVILTYILRTLILITIFSAAMAICWQPVAATQFALYMAVGNLGISTGAALLGPLSQVFSYPQTLLVLAVVAFAAIAVTSRLRLERHVDRLQELTTQRQVSREEGA